MSRSSNANFPIHALTITDYFQALHEPLYALRWVNLGGTYTIVPIGDLPDAPSATTFTTRVLSTSGSSQTGTWVTAPSAFATPYTQTQAATFTDAGLHGPAGIPGIKYSGAVAERLTIPDATYWTTSAGATAFSLIICGTVTATAGIQFAFCKFGATLEWEFRITAAETVEMRVQDNTAGVAIWRTSDAAVTLETPLHMVTTYNGATNANGMIVYVDGVAVASTATNDVAFVTMRDTAALVSVGASTEAVPAQPWAGVLYGGPFGPTFGQTALSAAQVLNDYRLFRGAMGLA